jgi:hypothetical protein
MIVKKIHPIMYDYRVCSAYIHTNFMIKYGLWYDIDLLIIHSLSLLVGIGEQYQWLPAWQNCLFLGKLFVQDCS